MRDCKFAAQIRHTNSPLDGEVLRKRMRKSVGVCKLTGMQGPFVRSHLLPKAVTRPSVRGNFFIQGGYRELPPKIKWDSWYDDDLVTRDGENILARYDSWAIQELSRLELIWKSWGPTTCLGNSVTVKPGFPSFGVRTVKCKNPSLLRLFFLSLLWRASATGRPEFQGIQLRDDHLDQLQRMVRDGDPNPLGFYPTTLLQIASRGPAHNLVPLSIDNTFDTGAGGVGRHHVFRFYFDGLIANMHRSKDTIEGLEPFIVGAGVDLVVQMQLYEDSFQLGNLVKLVAENARQWPEQTAKITGRSKK